MADFEDFYSLVNQDVSGCPDIEIDNALRRAAIEFCTRSLACTQDVGPYPMVNGVREIYLDEDADVQILTVRDARWSGHILRPIHDWRTVSDYLTATGTPTRYVIHQRDQIRLYPIPAGLSSSGELLYVNVSVRPTRDARSLPDVLLDQHDEAIANGAVAILMQKAGKVWSNPAEGKAKWRAFISQCSAARAEVEFGLSEGSIRAKTPAFGY